MLGFLPLIVAKYDRWMKKKKKKKKKKNEIGPVQTLNFAQVGFTSSKIKKKFSFMLKQKRDYRQNTVKWINIYSTNEKISI